jgi:hypothetical protein
MTDRPPTDQDRAAALDAALALLGIAVEPEWRASILAHLKVTTDAATFLLDFPLDDEIEPAPVYRL